MPDPTKPVYPENTKATAINFEGEPKLTAIWISAKSRWATINGIRAKQGQMIPGNIRIFKINRHSVTISQNGDVKTLQLLK
jgi:hypothetical protein